MKPNIEYVKQEMERRKWTGSQLAMKMGVSRMEVSRLLRGRRVGGKKCIGGLIKAFPDAELKDLFFFGLSGTYSFRRKENCMEQVKNLNDKRVCDQSKDGKVIVIRKKHSRLRMNMRSKFKQKSVRAPDDSTDT